MKVLDLINILQQASPDREVAISYDSDCCYADIERTEDDGTTLWLSTTAKAIEGPEPPTPPAIRQSACIVFKEGRLMRLDNKPDAEGIAYPDRANPTVPSEARCQETHGMIAGQYLRCGAPATMVVDHGRGEPAYWMCDECGDHNVRNRGAKRLV